MKTSYIIKTALHSLNQHKTRSFLTTLGIIVGIVSIIAVNSIGEGAKCKINSEISRLGTNFIIVIGSSAKKIAQQRGAFQNLSLKEADYKAILNECEDIFLASPGLMGSAKIIHEGTNWQTSIAGVNEYYAEIRNWPLEKGAFFNTQHVKSNQKVAVLGKTVAKELFDTANPIGKIIRIKKQPFKVIGVLTELGKLPDGRDQDDIVIVPLGTAQKKILGVKNNSFAAIIISAKKKERMEAIATEVKAILRQRHKLRANDEDDFTIFTQDDISQATDAASYILNLLLIIIASISLIVGGIGIMNIMLVTVTERTKEIGIRMAIGATSQNIQNQFLIESIVICLIGGGLGISLGIIISRLVNIILGWPVFVSLTSILISLLSSTLIGIFFGYWPAYKASKLNPVEALFER